MTRIPSGIGATLVKVLLEWMTDAEELNPPTRTTMKKHQPASTKKPLRGRMRDTPVASEPESSKPTDTSIGQDGDANSLFADRVDFLNQLEKSQEAYVDALEEIREETGPTKILDVAAKRKTAMAAVRAISNFAKSGDVSALTALYSIAELATDELGQQSLKDRRAIAADQLGWPVKLSNSAVWNKKHTDECLYNLGLGRDLHILTRIDTIVVKASFLKDLVARLVALIAGWRQAEQDQELVGSIGYCIRKEGYGEDAVLVSKQIARRKLRNTRRRNIEKVKGLIRILKIEKDKVLSKIELHRGAAIKLPDLTRDRKTQTQWFDVAMKLLEALTDTRYESERYGLRQWWGANIRTEHEAIERQKELRNGIRDRMKKAFHQMLADPLK